MSDLSRSFPPDAIEANISISRRLRHLLPEIEDLAQKGVPRKVILEHLNANGFNLSMNTYATILKRLRKEVKKNGRLAINKEEKPNTPKTDGNVSRVSILYAIIRSFDFRIFLREFLRRYRHCDHVNRDLALPGLNP